MPVERVLKAHLLAYGGYFGNEVSKGMNEWERAD